MKRKIALNELKPGTRFTADIFIDDDHIFTPANLEIRMRDIEAMKRWKINHLFTEGNPIEEDIAITLDDQDLIAGEAHRARNKDFEEPTKQLSELDFSIHLSILRNQLQEVFDEIENNAISNSRPVDELVSGILGLANRNLLAAKLAISTAETDKGDLAMASAKGAILAALISQNLGLSPHKVENVVIGMLLHDVGMLKIPVQIREKSTVLSEEEQLQIRSHPLYSYKIITRQLLYAHEAGNIGLQHHERWDGEGYPRKTTDEKIELPARIGCVADAFVAMTHPRKYRKSMIGYHAMKALLSDNGRRFDPSVIKACVECLGIYPTGSLVQLNNSAIALTLENNPLAPIKPKLRIIIDEHGFQYPKGQEEEIDLSFEKALFIAKAIDPAKLITE